MKIKNRFIFFVWMIIFLGLVVLSSVVSSGISQKNTRYAFIVFSIFTISLTLGFKVLFSGIDFTHTAFARIYLKIKDILIYLLAGIYFVIFSILSIAKFNAYNLCMIDLGRMDQVVWNTLHGRLFMGTFEFGNFTRIFAHFEPIFILIAPLYLVFSSPKMLLILQALVVSLGAIAVFRLAKLRVGGSFFAICLAAAYLLYPTLQYACLADFHPDMLATTFLLFTFYYMLKKKWLQYGIFLLLSLICREYVSIIVIMLGLFILIREKMVKTGILTLSVGTLWAIGTFIVLPHFLPADFTAAGIQDTYRSVSLYKTLGDNPIEIIVNILSHPIRIAKEYITLDVIGTFFLLFLPVGFLSIFALPVLIICLPIFAAVILASFFYYTNHHNGIIIPFIFISAIYGANFVFNKGKYFLDKNNFIRRFLLKSNNLVYAVSVFVLSSSLLSCLFYGHSPLSIGFWQKSSYRYWANIHNFRVTEHDRVADKFVKMIPPGATVSASNNLASHLSHRETIHAFCFHKFFDTLDYVLLDLLEYFPLGWEPREKEVGEIKALLLNKKFGLRFWQDGILLFQRDYPKDKGYHVNAKVVKEATPRYPLNSAFGDKLLFLGYDLDYDNIESGYNYRIVYYWKVLDNFAGKFSYNYFDSQEELEKSFMVVDKFKKGAEEFRIVHLPLYLLHTPKEWKPGEIIKEEFEFYLPRDVIREDFQWKIGLYAVPDLFFIETRQRDLVPDTREIELKIKEKMENKA